MIKNIGIEKILPYSANAKKHAKKQVRQIADSIQSFGFNQPIVVDKSGVIIVGHGRYEAAKLLGLAEVPVIVVNLSEEKAKAYRLTDNKLNESPWEMELVVEELKKMSEEMLRLTGFSLDLIMDPESKDDVLPEQVSPRAKTGDMYALGNHRIVCGDSCEASTFERFGDEKASMTFTDPPYNVDYEGKTKEKLRIQSDKMAKPDFKIFLERSFKNIVTHTQGGIYICMSTKEFGTCMDAFEAAQGHWSSTIIWVKNNFTLGRADYQNSHEPILYGWAKNLKNHYFIERRDVANVWEDLANVKAEYDGTFTTISFQGFKIKLPGKIDRGSVIRKKQRLDIFRHDKPSRSNDHPTMKPVALMCEAISNSSQEGEIVLDPFLGSGSTLIACEKMGRVCHGIELDPRYVDSAIARWEEYTKQKAKKIS